MSRVRGETKSLGLEIDELRHGQDRTTRELGQLADEVKASGERMAALSAQATEAAEAIRKLGARVEDAEVTVARLRASLETAPRETPTAASPAAPAAPPVPPRPRGAEPGPRATTPEQAYAGALAVFQAREYGQAVLDFLEFLARYPKHKLASNAQYWIGEAYYVQRDYRQATLEFQKVIGDDSRGTKAPDALVKLGLCYAELRQPERAQELWQQVLREYPDSESAEKARRLIRARGAGARRSR